MEIHYRQVLLVLGSSLDLYMYNILVCIAYVTGFLIHNTTQRSSDPGSIVDNGGIFSSQAQEARDGATEPRRQRPQSEGEALTQQDRSRGQEATV